MKLKNRKDMRGLEELKKYLLPSVDDATMGYGNFGEKIAAAKTRRELLQIITDCLPVIYKAGIVSKKFFEREFEAKELADAGIYIYGWHEVRDRKVFALDKAKVWACGNSDVWAYDNSTVDARDYSRVHAHDYSEVFVHDYSDVWAYNGSKVFARDDSDVWAFDNSKVCAYNSSEVRAYSDSDVWAYNNSAVWAYGNSEVWAYNNSAVWAYDKARLCDLRDPARRIP